MKSSYSYKKTNHRANKKIYSAVIALLVIAFTLFHHYINNAEIVDTPTEKEIYHTVHFLDVLQGDCTLIETQDGKFALIDASTNEASAKITKFLDYRNVKEIEYLILTHPHEDHIGSADDVLDNYKVKNVYMTDKTETTKAYENLLTSLQESKTNHGTKVIYPENGDVFSLSGIKFKVISDGRKYDDLNNSSICLRASFGKSSLLFTGDAEKEVEDDLLERGISLDAEIYKCAHHGSSTSNSEDFLDKVNPKIAIISCGYGNDYGHPHKEVISSLTDRGVPFYITHKDGNISIDFSKKNILSPVAFFLSDTEPAEPVA